jgi:sugar phosphate isomerase/epimerase
MKGARIEFFGLQLGPKQLPLFLPFSNDYRDFLLNDLANFETRNGILVGVENMPARRLLGLPVDIHQMNDLETLSNLPHLTLDTTHLGTWGMDLMATYEILKARIVHVHLSNFDGSEHQLPDSGHLPLSELLRELTADGYSRVVTVELNPAVLEAEDEDQVRSHLARAVDFCREGISG